MGDVHAGKVHYTLQPPPLSLTHAPHTKPIPLQSHSSDDASANKSARMDELRSNLAALTIDFSQAPPSSQLRNRPPPPPRTHPAHAAAPSAATASDDGHELQPSTQPPPPSNAKSLGKSPAPQPFRRAKAKI